MYFKGLREFAYYCNIYYHLKYKWLSNTSIRQISSATMLVLLKAEHKKQKQSGHQQHDDLTSFVKIRLLLRNYGRTQVLHKHTMPEVYPG
jgi:hypothetical protein